MAQTPAETIGRNIRAEMARRGLAQSELAAHLGMSQSQMSKRLRGGIVLDVEELLTIAAFLEVPLSVLLPMETSVA